MDGVVVPGGAHFLTVQDPNDTPFQCCVCKKTTQMRHRVHATMSGSTLWEMCFSCYSNGVLKAAKDAYERHLTEPHKI
jgi:hypothetical protein